MAASTLDSRIKQLRQTIRSTHPKICPLTFYRKEFMIPVLPTRKDPASDAAKSGVGLIRQPCSEGRTGKILVLREMRHTGLREELR